VHQPVHMFEITGRDAAGRCGVLSINGRRLETPAILPVVNPKKMLITPRELAEMGFQGIITNSYIIYRDEGLREEALAKGIHALLDFDGVIMTDSGSFQLFRYRRVEVSQREILEFQDRIGVDIGVMLDIPTPPDVPASAAERDAGETLLRAEEAAEFERRMLLTGTVQGSTYPELRRRLASRISELGFEVHAIGGVVPLMEDYRFAELVRLVMPARQCLGHAKPVHLFGAGHPMLFSLAVLMGCDMFDSAAYALYARDGRYITPSGTLRLEELRELPCSCRVCSEHTIAELRSLDAEEREKLLAEHNLLVSLEEVRRVRQAVHEGSLWELVERRARAHPRLLEALHALHAHSDYIEALEPVTKPRAFFYTGAESLLRPAVRRHLERLGNIELRGRELVLLQEAEKPFSRSYRLSSSRRYHICVVSQVFGIIPLEVEESYPLMQHEGLEVPEEAQLRHMRRAVDEYAAGFERVHVHTSLAEVLNVEGEVFESHGEFRADPDPELKLRALADYQFGRGAGRMLFSSARAEYSRQGMLRRAYSDEGELLATLRPEDGVLVLTIAGARRLLRLPPPMCRVVVDEEAERFVREGRSVYARFVKACDPAVRPGSEVLVVNGEDELLATGRAVLSAQEMLELGCGVAVKTRHGCR